MGPLGWDHFWPQENNLNKLCRSQLGESVKHMTLGVGPFWPQGYNLDKLGRGSLGDAAYQISRH